MEHMWVLEEMGVLDQKRDFSWLYRSLNRVEKYEGREFTFESFSLGLSRLNILELWGQVVGVQILEIFDENFSKVVALTWSSSLEVVCTSSSQGTELGFRF